MSVWFRSKRAKKGTDGEPVLEIGKQAAPLRSVDLAERIRTERPEAEACIGDQGWKLADVCDKGDAGTVFIPVIGRRSGMPGRGEGMCSPKANTWHCICIRRCDGFLKRHLASRLRAARMDPPESRMDCGTIAFSLPNGTLLACTFNPELVEQLYEMEGMELRKGIRLTRCWGPA